LKFTRPAEDREAGFYDDDDDDDGEKVGWIWCLLELLRGLSRKEKQAEYGGKAS